VLLLVGKTVSPALESLLGALTTELDRRLTVDEVLDGRIAVDVVLLAKILLDSAIDLSDNEGRVGVGIGEFLPGRSKTLAVTAPWGEELHSKGLLGELGIKVLNGERENTNLLLLSGLLLSGLLLSGLGFLDRLLISGLISDLGHVIHVGLNSAGHTDLLSLTTVGDELDGGETTDIETSSKILLNSAINLSDVEFALGLLSELDPGGSETLAVTAPGGEELDEPETLLGLLIEVGLGKDLNLRGFLSESANDASCEDKIDNRLHPVKQNEKTQ